MTVLKIPPQSQFLREMDSRGHIYQVTDDQGLDTYAAGGQRVAYIGFDATAPSLH
ncbi:MAG: tyrosine--tRNA ligase, partial [Rhizobiaceae bacterium]